jgi:hypothetical protein
MRQERLGNDPVEPWTEPDVGVRDRDHLDRLREGLAQFHQLARRIELFELGDRSDPGWVSVRIPRGTSSNKTSRA